MKEDNDPTEYEPFDPECGETGELYPGDKCPNCGDCLSVRDIIYKENGNKVELGYTEASTSGQNLWCEDCWEKVASQVRGLGSHTLDEYY